MTARWRGRYRRVSLSIIDVDWTALVHLAHQRKLPVESVLLVLISDAAQAIRERMKQDEIDAQTPLLMARR